ENADLYVDRLDDKVVAHGRVGIGWYTAAARTEEVNTVVALADLHPAILGSLRCDERHQGLRRREVLGLDRLRGPNWLKGSRRDSLCKQISRSLRVNRSGVAERQNALQALGFMATNLNPISPDALLKIVEQVKEYYVEPPPKRQRGRPRTFSGLAFLLLAVVGVVLRTFKPPELYTLLTKDASLRQALGFGRVPHRRTIERRLDATLPEAEAQVQALGHQILAEVEPGPDEPQASAIDGRM